MVASVSNQPGREEDDTFGNRFVGKSVLLILIPDGSDPFGGRPGRPRPTGGPGGGGGGGDQDTGSQDFVLRRRRIGRDVVASGRNGNVIVAKFMLINYKCSS